VSTTKIPTSKAKTAYGLLSEVAALALAEPKRIDMSRWVCREGSPSQYEWDYVAPLRGYPACGTVGCIGGWVDTLTRKKVGDAYDTLGLGLDAGNELFMPPWWADRDTQSRAHARKVVAHIRKFQKKYASQLKRKKV